ncbi:MAG: D-alanyl-D-alanine carboxypeptidase/D-alanyl-D-alanine-endopeptidase [Elusimicrobiaceae bacterium]|nr:D-alanyl-D-alanine carboxypeptidase/D-alanyl-D-alanine-endopeptidase [Elusimicrobiaceae bacterium]
MRKIAFLIIALGFPACAADRQAVLPELLGSYETGALADAQWSFRAVYTADGTELASFNSGKNLCPASGMKLFTTAAALELLGPDHRFKTELLYSGSIDDEDGVLKGDLYIRGGGDPTLGSDRVKGSLSLARVVDKWARAAKAAGIRELRGFIRPDDSYFKGDSVPGKWFWEDVGNYYGAQASALSVNDNILYLHFKPGRKPGLPAILEDTNPALPNFTLQNNVLTGPAGSGDNAFVYNGPDSYSGYVSGTVPAGPLFSVKAALPEPGVYLGHELLAALSKAGIKTPFGVRKAAKDTDSARLTKLTETLSPPLDDIIFVTNKTSFNLYAETMLRHLSASGKAEDGIKNILLFLSTEGVSAAGLKMYDGSGLSRADTVTARSVTDLLARMTAKSYFREFYASLPVAGDPADLGRMKDFGAGTPLAKNARVKTGYMEGVKSFSGYMKDRSGRQIAFSFIANNFSTDSRQLAAIAVQLLNACY